MRGRERGEVMAYLAIMMNITDAIDLGKGRNKTANIKRMQSDLQKIASDI